MITFKQFFTEQEESSKAAVFAYGRYNPPTTGHQLLIDKLEETAKQNNADAFLIPTHTQDKKKNPLTFEEKKKILQQMCTSAKILDTGKTFVDVLHDLELRGYTTVIQVAGSDRIPEFQGLVDTYNGKPNKKGEIVFNLKNYKIVSSGDRDPDSESVTGMSASKLRALALASDYQAFEQGMSPLVDNNTKRKTYEIIRSRLV